MTKSNKEKIERINYSLSRSKSMHRVEGKINKAFQKFENNLEAIVGLSLFPVAYKFFEGLVKGVGWTVALPVAVSNVDIEGAEHLLNAIPEGEAAMNSAGKLILIPAGVAALYIIGAPLSIVYEKEARKLNALDSFLNSVDNKENEPVKNNYMFGLAKAIFDEQENLGLSEKKYLELIKRAALLREVVILNQKNEMSDNYIEHFYNELVEYILKIYKSSNCPKEFKDNAMIVDLIERELVRSVVPKDYRKKETRKIREMLKAKQKA